MATITFKRSGGYVGQRMKKEQMPIGICSLS